MIAPFTVSIPAGVNVKLPAPSLIPSTGSMVIFSTPPKSKAIFPPFAVAGLKTICPPLSALL